jgi:hypothetical protein
MSVVYAFSGYKATLIGLIYAWLNGAATPFDLMTLASMTF